MAFFSLFLGIKFGMNPRSTGNYHGYTGRNEHGDPHLVVQHQNNIVEVYIKDCSVKSVKQGEYTRTMKKYTELYINQFREKLLHKWETQDFSEMKVKRNHR